MLKLLYKLRDVAAVSQRVVDVHGHGHRLPAARLFGHLPKEIFGQLSSKPKCLACDTEVKSSHGSEEK